MHGVKKNARGIFSRETPEEIAAMQKKIAMFTKLSSKILSLRKAKVCSPTALMLTEQMLVRNPDWYTGWNYRREILLSTFAAAAAGGGGTTAEAAQCALELELTQKALKTGNPKSYGAWHHRKWVFCRGFTDVAKELALCKLFLSFDERNFHCWNYRSFLVATADVAVEHEIAFSMAKVNDNFSNYSAWHWRSKYLLAEVGGGVAAEEGEGSGALPPAPPGAVATASAATPNAREAEVMRRLQRGQVAVPGTAAALAALVARARALGSPAGSDAGDPSAAWTQLWSDVQDAFEGELALLETAVFTEPDDQSCWVYLLWCVAVAAQGARDGASSIDAKVRGRSVEMCRALLEEEEDECKWPMLTLVRMYWMQRATAVGAAGAESAESAEGEISRDECVALLEKLVACDGIHQNYYRQLLTQI